MRRVFTQITAVSLRFRWVTIILTFAIIGLGLNSFTQLNQELLPDIEFPQSFVVVQNGGATSDQILTMYTVPLEDEAQTITDVVNVETTSNDGFGLAIIRNEFGANQERILDDLDASIATIPLPIRTINPPKGQSASDLIGELSPEVMLWLYNWAVAEDSGFLPQLTEEAFSAFSSAALGALPSEAYEDISSELLDDSLPSSVTETELPTTFDYTMVAPPALPESWQGDSRFATAEDIVELTTTRNLAGVFNSFIDDGSLVGPLGRVNDLTVADLENILAIEETCRTFDRTETEDDPCSFISDLDGAAILAMDDALIDLLPENYLESLGTLERENVAAVRVANELGGEAVDADNVLLPDSWRAEYPQIITFNFSDFPLGAISISSDELTEAELQDFIDNELVPTLRELDLVAEVNLAGGEIIPVPIQNTAREEVGLPLLEETAAEDAESSDSDEETSEADSETTEPASDLPEGPALPPAWAALQDIVGLEELDTADDAFAIIGQDIQGISITSIAELFNQIATQETARVLLEGVDQGVYDYFVEQEPDFYDNLNAEARSVVLESPLLGEPWALVAEQTGQQFDIVQDLVDVGAVDTITLILETTESQGLEIVGIQLIDSLSADAINALATDNPDFLTELANSAPNALLYLSVDALQSDAVTEFINSTDNEDLVEQLIAIRDGDQPTALENAGGATEATANDEPVELGATWAQLSTLLGENTPLNTVDDLIAVDAVTTISTILSVTEAPGLTSYGIRLIDSLSADAINALATDNPDFLTELANSAPNALLYLSVDALQSDAVTEFINSTDNEDLVEQLIAIRDGDQPTALENSVADDVIERIDDPNAPALAQSWVGVVQFVDTDELDTADDMFYVGGYNGAADLVNQFALSPQGRGLVEDLTTENWVYLGDNEETFWANISATSLRLINLEAVDVTQFPQAIQNRIAAGGETFKPDTSVTRTNYSPSLLVNIFKEDAANTVVAWEDVKAVLDEYESRDDIVITEVFEQASFITTSLEGVQREGSLGAVMAIVMILIFMNVSVRSTAVVSISIPGSVMFAFILIRFLPGNVYDVLDPIVQDMDTETFLGSVMVVVLRLFPESITLNIMTLSGLTVAIGRVVDDSIVVLENIYRNIGLIPSGEETAERKRAAVLNGAREVNVAIFAATLTTMVVFIPLGLFGGVTGAFFLPFGLTVAYALVGSYLMAITIVPVVTELFISRDNMPEEGTITVTDTMSGAEKAWANFANIFIGAVAWMSRVYGVLIRGALSTKGNKLVILIATILSFFLGIFLPNRTLALIRGALISKGNKALVLLAATLSFFFGIYLLGQRPVQFLPSLGEPTMTVTVDLPAEFNGQPTGIAYTNAKVAQFEAWLAEQQDSGVGITDVQVTVGGAGGFDLGGGGAGDVTETNAVITVVLDSQETIDSLLEPMRIITHDIFDDMDNDGVLDYANEDGSIPDVFSSNVSVSGVAADGGFGGFALVVQGTESDNQPSLTELAAYNDDILAAMNQVDGLVNVELESNVTAGSTTYIRIDGVPALRYIGEVESDDTLGVTAVAIADVQAAIDAKFESDDSLTVPVEVGEGFESEQQSDGIAEIGLSMLLATMIAYGILVATFINFSTFIDIVNGFIIPIEILFSLPLAVVGAAIALTVTDRVLGLPAMVGLLMLIGIVVTNAIVFLDRVLQNKREYNMSVDESLVEAGETRLRPILMTAATTTIAQLPLAMSTESGAIIAAELGTVVIGGLLSSTVLTLLVLPVAHSLINDFFNFVGGFIGGKEKVG